MSRHQGDPVAMRVVSFLGVASVLGIVASAALCFVSLRYEGNGNAGVVIAIVGNLASAALGALSAVLASTGKGAPQPVTVENSPSAPVPTADVPAAPAAPEPSPYSVGGSEPISDL